MSDGVAKDVRLIFEGHPVHIHTQGLDDKTGDVVICPGRNDDEPPVFVVTGEVTAFSRKVIVEATRRAYEALVPEKALVAAMETVRLMEEDAKAKEGFVVMVHTLPVCNQGWMKAGIDPTLGDLIARTRMADPGLFTSTPTEPLTQEGENDG